MSVAPFAIFTVLTTLGVVALIAVDHFVDYAQQTFGDSRHYEAAAKFRRAF